MRIRNVGSFGSDLFSLRLVLIIFCLVKVESAHSISDQNSRKGHSVNICGPNSLWLACQVLRVEHVSEEDVYSLFPNDGKETNFSQLAEAATKLGIKARGVHTNYNRLVSEHVPAIIRLNGDHFALFVGVLEDKVLLGDAPNGNLKLSESEFTSQWDSNALLLSPQRELTSRGSIAKEGSDIGLFFHVTSVDFGLVKEGVRPSQVLKFINKSEKTIRITKVTKSCGCAKLEFPDEGRSYLPKESGEITVAYDTAGIAGAGAQEIWIHTDYSTKPIQLKIAIRIARDVALVPDNLKFGEIVRSELPMTRYIHVQHTGNQDFQLAGLSCDMPFLKVSCDSQVRSSDSQIEVRVTATADTPIGISNTVTHFSVVTADGLIEKSVPISINVLSPTRFENEDAFLGVARPGEIVRKNIRFVGVDDWLSDRYAIGTTEKDWMHVEKAIIDGVPFVVCTAIMPKGSAELHGTVWVDTPDGERIECSVYGMVR